jgi:hypothetical protein
MARLIEQNWLTEARLPKRPTDGHVWDDNLQDYTRIVTRFFLLPVSKLAPSCRFEMRSGWQQVKQFRRWASGGKYPPGQPLGQYWDEGIWAE